MRMQSMTAPVLMLSALLVAIASQAQTALPSQSIYHLDAALVSQAGQQHGLDVYREHPVLITMFYGSCPAACPLLIDTVRTIERALTEQERAQLRVLMISIDPERDTIPALAALAKEREVNLSRWTLAHADAATVRKVAAVLNVQYRRLPNGQYSHSSVITVLSPQGEILKQSSVLGRADADLLTAIGQATPHWQLLSGRDAASLRPAQSGEGAHPFRRPAAEQGAGRSRRVYRPPLSR